MAVEVTLVGEGLVAVVTDQVLRSEPDAQDGWTAPPFGQAVPCLTGWLHQVDWFLILAVRTTQVIKR